MGEWLDDQMRAAFASARASWPDGERIDICEALTDVARAAVPSGPWVLRADLDALLDPLPEPVHDYALGARNQLIVIKDALDALTHGRSEDEGEPT